MSTIIKHSEAYSMGKQKRGIYLLTDLSTIIEA
jgi:hypothetical protein